MVLFFKNVGERCTTKSCKAVGPFSVVSKILQITLNNKLSDHFKKCGFFLLLIRLQVFSSNGKFSGSCI